MTRTHGFSSLEVTDHFNKRYERLQPNAQRNCDKAVSQLLETPLRPGLQFKPIQPRKKYWEARPNRGDRLIVRPDGDRAILIDIVDHDDLGKYGT